MLEIGKTAAVFRFSIKALFHTMFGFTRLEYTPGNTYSSKKPINTSGTDKYNSKCDCNSVNITNGKRAPILYSFSLGETIGHKNF